MSGNSGYSMWLDELDIKKRIGKNKFFNHMGNGFYEASVSRFEV